MSEEAANIKRKVVRLVQAGHDAWRNGDPKRALEDVNDALELLVNSGQSEETMPTVFDLIYRVRGHLLPQQPEPRP